MNILGLHASRAKTFSSAWLENILASNNQKDYKRSSQVTPLVYCQVMSERHQRARRLGAESRELSIRPLCLALNSRLHTEQRWAAKREQGEIWRLNCHSPQRKKNSEIVKVKVLSGPPFFPQQNCLGNSHHNIHFHGASQEENSDLGLLGFTSNKDFTRCNECCCGIKLLLSG